MGIISSEAMLWRVSLIDESFAATVFKLICEPALTGNQVIKVHKIRIMLTIFFK